MKKILHSFLIVGIIVLASCTEEEPEPVNPVIGEWLLSNFKFTNLTNDFSGWEGYSGPAYWGESSYELILNDDFTFSRDLLVGTNEFAEAGDWESDGEDLFLDPDGSGIGIYEDFTIVEATAKDLIISTDINEFLVPDIYYDTVSQVYLDSLVIWEVENTDQYNAELAKIFQLTAVTLVYEFDKTND